MLFVYQVVLIYGVLCGTWCGAKCGYWCLLLLKNLLILSVMRLDGLGYVCGLLLWL